MLDEIVEGLDRAPGLASGPRFGTTSGPHLELGGAILEATADALGLTEDQLLQRLRRGRTLGQIADAQGKAIADVRAAAQAAAKRELDEAVQDGRLTQSQADELLDRIADDIARFPFDRRFGRHP